LIGVISGSVLRRRGELAIRMAMGATSRSVMRLVLGEGARLVSVGLLLSVPGIYIAGAALRGLLIGVSPFDVVTLTSAGVFLFAVALSACYLAARRVNVINPASLLNDA